MNQRRGGLVSALALGEQGDPSAGKVISGRQGLEFSLLDRSRDDRGRLAEQSCRILASTFIAAARSGHAASTTDWMGAPSALIWPGTALPSMVALTAPAIAAPEHDEDLGAQDG